MGAPEGAMANIKIFTIVVVAAASAGTVHAYAGQGGGGHGGGAYSGGGGGSYYSGGSSYGGGRMPYADGGGRYGGGNRMRDTPRYEGAPRYADRPAMSRLVGRPYFGHRHFHGRPEFNGHRDLSFSRNRNAPTPGQVRSSDVRTNAARNASSARAIEGTPRNSANLRFPNARAQIVPNAATAGAQDGRGGHGWWRHRNGGFGWAGPLYW